MPLPNTTTTTQGNENEQPNQQNAILHLQQTMHQTGNWEDNKRITKIIKEITTKEVMRFIKFPTHENLAVNGSIYKLFKKRMEKLVTEEKLSSEWRYYAKVIRSSMSQQRSNNAIQFGIKLKGNSF